MIDFEHHTGSSEVYHRKAHRRKASVHHAPRGAGGGGGGLGGCICGSSSFKSTWSWRMC